MPEVGELRKLMVDQPPDDWTSQRAIAQDTIRALYRCDQSGGYSVWRNSAGVWFCRFSRCRLAVCDIGWSQPIRYRIALPQRQPHRGSLGLRSRAPTWCWTISPLVASLMHSPAIQFSDDARWFGYVQLRLVNGRSSKAVAELFSIPVY